jgi:hypothetical protein
MIYCVFFYLNFLEYAANKGLCGKPLNNPCNTPPTKSIVQPNSDPSTQGKGKNKKILIVVIVVVAMVVLASILALLFIQSRRRRRSEQDQPILGLQLNSESSPSVKETKSIDLAGDFSKGENGELNFVREDKGGFELQDLLRASAEVLGSGSFGSTYKAIVLNGPTVVVKRFRHMNNVGKQEFFEHMKKLGSLTHPNLLPLIAFYYKKEEKFLVYDFGENGSLASHLHGMQHYIFMNSLCGHINRYRLTYLTLIISTLKSYKINHIFYLEITIIDIIVLVRIWIT